MYDMFRFDAVWCFQVTPRKNWAAPPGQVMRTRHGMVKLPQGEMRVAYHQRLG